MLHGTVGILAALLAASSANGPVNKQSVNTNVDNRDQTISALNMNEEIAFWVIHDPKARCEELQVARRARGPWHTIEVSDRIENHPLETWVDPGFEDNDPSDGRDFMDEINCYRMRLFDARGRHFRTYPPVCVPASVEPDLSVQQATDEPQVVTEMTPTNTTKPENRPTKRFADSCAARIARKAASSSH